MEPCIILNITQSVFLFGSGLPLGAKFLLGRTQKTPFSLCFDLNPLEIRGVTFSIAKFWSEKIGMDTIFCQPHSIFCLRIKDRGILRNTPHIGAF